TRVFGDRHCGGGGSFWKRTRPTDIQRLLHLGQPQNLAIPAEGRAGILGGLFVMACLEGGIASPTLKEVGEGTIQMAQSLLEWHTGDFSEKGLLMLMFECSGNCAE